MPDIFPTNLYPRVIWTTSLSIDAAGPAVLAQPAFAIAKAENIAFSGKKETIVARREEVVTVALARVEPQEAARWRAFHMDHALRGKQFEFLLDRFTGTILSFVNTVNDLDATGIASYTTTASYTTAANQVGLIITPSQAVLVRNNIGSENVVLTHSEGTFVLTCVVSKPSGDIGPYHLFDTRCGVVTGNGLVLYWQAGETTLTGYSSPQSYSQVTKTASVSWPAGAVVTFMVRWTATLSLDLYITVQGSNTVTASVTGVTTGPGGLGSFTTFANTITLMTRPLLENSHTTLGVVLHAGFYRAAYTEPSILASHFPMGRNYWSRAELTGAQVYQPGRTVPSVDLWDISMNIRQGF